MNDLGVKPSQISFLDCTVQYEDSKFRLFVQRDYALEISITPPRQFNLGICVIPPRQFINVQLSVTVALTVFFQNIFNINCPSNTYLSHSWPEIENPNQKRSDYVSCYFGQNSNYANINSENGIYQLVQWCQKYHGSPTNIIRSRLTIRYIRRMVNR